MRQLLSIAFLFICFGLHAQSIVGQLQSMPHQTLQLLGFDGLQTYTIAQTQTDANGNFSLPYAESDYGVGALIGSTQTPYFVLLTPEQNVLVGTSLADVAALQWVEGQQNQQFAQYATEQPKREQALVAWEYIAELYQQPVFKPFNQQSIHDELKRLQTEDSAFIAQLPANSYVRWYLPTRKLVSSVRTVAQYRTAEIPATIKAFRTLNHADNRLYKSGLLKDALEGHFWLIENSGLPLDSVAVEMQRSIDVLLEQLVVDNAKLNTITDFLFDLLERHSLFQASEYLAIKVLNETSCTLNSDLAKQLETYRAMKKGNKAANIEFNTPYIKVGPQSTSAQSLSDIESPYTLVVFGASWCTKCTEELPKIATKYTHWKAQGLEVIFVSLDTDQQALEAFAKNFPFTTLCDFKKWESPMAVSYYVFGTPTMFLLNKDLTIELPPNSVQQVDAWVDWFLADKNNNESN